MHKLFSKKLVADGEKTAVESAQKFKLGQGYVPKPLDRDNLPPLKTIVEFPGVDPVALDALRQQQKALGLFDDAGYLYDPKTKQWVAPNWRVPELHDNLNYFLDWPEMLNGLPAGAERVDDSDDDCEASFGGDVMVVDVEKPAADALETPKVNSSAFYQPAVGNGRSQKEWKFGDGIEPSEKMIAEYANKKSERGVIVELPLLSEFMSQAI